MAKKDVFVIDNGELTDYTGSDETVTIPTSVSTIGLDVFKGNNTIKKVILHKGVHTIGFNAFEGCTSLTEMVIPDSIKALDIGIEAFKGCSKLQKLTLPESTYVSPSAFIDCKSMADKEGFVIYNCFYDDFFESIISNSAVGILFGYYGKETEVIIPNEVNFISDYAFCDCKKIKEIHLPKNLQYVGIDAYRGCTDLKKIIVPKELTTSDKLDNLDFHGEVKHKRVPQKRPAPRKKAKNSD